MAALQATINSVAQSGRNTVITISTDKNTLQPQFEDMLNKIDTTAAVKSKIIVVIAAGNSNVPIS
ncbi:MAG: hypothetical protein WCJ81_06340 [bacterium]